MANPTIVVGSKFDSRGFKKAESAVSKLNKSVKHLAKSFGVIYGTQQVVKFGMASVKAFTADDKAAKALGQTLKNTGNALAGKGAESFIAKLEKTAAVSDDQLRPAFTNLLNSTRDYSLSQKELNLALDISAGTGKDVISVSAALAKAYSGNTTSLSKLGTGISKATLATGDMVVINKELAKLFDGQAKIAADSYAGSFDKLTIAGNNAKEVIGKGIVQALTEANGGFDNSITEIQKWAKAVSDAIIDIGRLGRFANALLGFVWKFPTTALRDYKNTLKDLQAQHALDFAPATGTPSGALAVLAKESRLANKSATDRMKADKKAAAAKIAADKKAAAVKLALAKGAAAFDLDKIQLIAALKMNIDEDTRKRLLLLQALQGDDNDLIMKRLKELADYTQNADLRKLAGLKTITDAQLKALNDTLIAEVDAINKSKMSQDDKNKAIMEALNKYDAAVKAQGGATADQSDNLRILQIRNILAIATAQAIADKQKQDALDLYMKTLGLSPGKSIATNGAYVPPTLAEQVAIGAIGGTMSSGITTNNSSMGVGSNMSPAQLAAQQFGGGGSTTINNITVEGTVVDSAGLLAAIQGGVQTINRNGSSLSGVAGILATYL